MTGPADFLLELLSEEIPARMQARARNDLARMFAEELDKAGLKAEAIETFATPRRLALIARGLPVETAVVSEEIKGPRSSAPPQALDGFLRKTGLSREQLVERDGVLFAVIERAGQATAEVLGPAIERIVRDFPWPKSMRWGAASASTASLRWVRPLQGIVALLGDTIVPVDVDGVTGGAATVGHRFHHPGPITLGGASDYQEKLRACQVIVDQDERAAIIREGALALAAEAGLTLVEDEGLVAENAGLTEWPVPLLGRFDVDYLDVPPEVIQLTARTNQKYFVLRGSDGALANAFICTANIVANDGGAAIVAGNQRVLAARLSDARFFWEQDLKVPLRQQAKKLEHIVFHQNLGTLGDKTKRVGMVLAAILNLHTQFAGVRACLKIARVAKADLVTGTVGEFPELQGIAGARIAERQGYSERLVKLIENQYKTSSAVYLHSDDIFSSTHIIADNIDQIVTFFSIGEEPTGSRDPYAIRRSALTFIRLVLDGQRRLPLRNVIGLSLDVLGWVALRKAMRKIGERYDMAVEGAESEMVFDEEENLVRFRGQRFELDEEIGRSLKTVSLVTQSREELIDKVQRFLIDRLKVQQRDAGVRHDLIDAVFALGGEDDLVRLLAQVEALQSFVETVDGTNLLAGYKRAANILKKEEGRWTPDQVRGDGEIAAEEAALMEALDVAEPRAEQAVAAEEFGAAMSALASLREPIDRFFEQVTVNDPDPGIRARRLALLARFRDAVHRVADFSKIEG